MFFKIDDGGYNKNKEPYKKLKQPFEFSRIKREWRKPL